jgi:hypothetical protein
MEKDKVNIMYDENGNAIRVQMDYEIYTWLVDQVPQADQAFAAA